MNKSFLGRPFARSPFDVKPFGKLPFRGVESGDIISTLTWVANVSALVPEDYTDDGGGVISAWGPFSQATETAKALLVADAFGVGRPGIQFATGDSLVAADSVIADYAAGFTMYWVGIPPVDGSTAIFFTVPDINLIWPRYDMRSTTDAMWINFRLVGSIPTSTQFHLGAYVESVPYVFGYRVSGVTHTAWKEQTKETYTAAAGLNTTSGNARIYTSSDTLQFGRWLMSEDVHDDATATAVIAQLQAEWGIV